MTTQTYSSRALIEVAGPQAQPSGFGLYSAATVIDAVDTKIREGIRFIDEIAGGAAAFALNCPPSFAIATDDLNQAGRLWVEAPAFGVSAGVKVDHLEGLGTDELVKLARTRLSLQESQAAEAAFWTGKDAAGAVTNAPSLVSAATTVLGGGAVSLATGLGLLEEWIGQQGGSVGVIHGARHLLGTLNSLHVRSDGGKLRTLTGTPVALGTGYTGSSPAGVARTAGTSWLYVTGPVLAMRAPVTDVPNDPRLATDRTSGLTKVAAVRFLSIAHAVGAAAVQINLA